MEKSVGSIVVDESGNVVLLTATDVVAERGNGRWAVVRLVISLARSVVG